MYCNESVWVKVITNTELYLTDTLYSPRTADVDFFRNLNLNIETVFNISKNVIILGDLNVDLLNSYFHNLRYALILNSIIDVINNPTRQNSILDPILIPNNMEVSDSGIIILPQEISDHSATYVSIPFSYEIQQSYERTIWLYKKANFETLNQNIFDYDWNILLNGSVDESHELFTDTFIEIGKQCIPYIKVCV